MAKFDFKKWAAAKKGSPAPKVPGAAGKETGEPCPKCGEDPCVCTEGKPAAPKLAKFVAAKRRGL